MNRSFWGLPLAAALYFSAAPFACAAMQPDAMWNKTRPLMEEAAEIYATESDPERRGLWRKVTFRDSRMQNIIEDALVILGESVLTDNIEEVNRTGEKIRRLREEIKELRLKSIGAPEETKVPFKDTKERIAGAIREDESKIAAYEALMGELRRKAAENARAAGLDIPEETVDYLCMAPNGTTIAQIMSVAMNIKTLLSHVESQFGSSGAEGVQVAHTYAGLYFLCCRTHVQAYDAALEEIDEKFSPRLKKLRSDAVALLSETQDLLGGAKTESARATLRANMQTTQRAVTVMEEYGKYLSRQKLQLKRERQKADERLKLAVNTYKTVSLGSQVVGMVRNSVSDFESIYNFQIPDLNLIYGDIYRDEFSSLMEKLKAK